MKNKIKPAKRKPTIPKRNHRSKIAVQASSGNVFADIGLPNADEYQAKADLARQIGLIIESSGLSQSQAARMLCVDQPKVSALLRGNLKDFSTERLMRFITRLNRDVVITIRPPRNVDQPTVRISA